MNYPARPKLSPSNRRGMLTSPSEQCSRKKEAEDNRNKRVDPLLLAMPCRSSCAKTRNQNLGDKGAPSANSQPANMPLNCTSSRN